MKKIIKVFFCILTCLIISIPQIYAEESKTKELSEAVEEKKDDKKAGKDDQKEDKKEKQVKIMSEPLIAARMFSRSSSAAARPTSGFAPAPRPLVTSRPN